MFRPAEQYCRSPGSKDEPAANNRSSEDATIKSERLAAGGVEEKPFPGHLISENMPETWMTVSAMLGTNQLSEDEQKALNEYVTQINASMPGDES